MQAYVEAECYIDNNKTFFKKIKKRRKRKKIIVIVDHPQLPPGQPTQVSSDLNVGGCLRDGRQDICRLTVVR